MIAPLIAPAAAALMPPDHLRQQVEAFAGRPATVDPRLLLPDCATPDLDWAVPGRSVAMRCRKPEWRVFVALVGAAPAHLPVAAPATPAIRRGDRVVVEAAGEGFSIGLEAVAEADAQGGQVALRAASGGRRLSGIVGADGRVRIHGLRAMVNRR